MSELANLEVRVTGRGVGATTRELDQLSRAGGKAERSADSLGDAWGKLSGIATGVAGAFAAFEGATHMVEIQREFDRLNAGLITATGSTEEAAQAFGALQEFAAQTPYALAQSVEGFTKLVNLGLTPSERAMTAFGDISAAMGKDLIQFVEAVADATTGEFERLKEFGIKSKSMGDDVQFTFRGISTTVGKNAAEIEQYLTELSENNFAGAMAQRMDTLDGALSNLDDSWNAFVLSVSQSGIGDRFKEMAQESTSALDALQAKIESGEIESQLERWYRLIDFIPRGYGEMASAIEPVIDKATQAWDALVGEDLLDLLARLPYAIRRDFQLAWLDAMTSVQSKWIELKHGFLGATDPFVGGEERAEKAAKAEQKLLREEAEKARAGYEADYEARAQAIEDGKRKVEEAKMRGLVTEERAFSDAAPDDPVLAQLRGADPVLQDFEPLQEDPVLASMRRYGDSDRLAKYKVGADGPPKKSAGGSSSKSSKKSPSEVAVEKFDAAEQQLETQVERIERVYAEQQDVADRATGISEERRDRFLERAKAAHDQELADLNASDQQKLDAIMSGMGSEEDERRRFYEDKIQALRDYNFAEESERNRHIAQVQAAMDKELAAMKEAKAEEQRERLSAAQERVRGLQYGGASEFERIDMDYAARVDEINSAGEEERAAVMANKQLTMDQQFALLEQSEQKEAALRQQATEDKLDAERDSVMQNTQIALGGMESLLDGFAATQAAAHGRDSAAYKRAFAVSKAFGIAEATLAMSIAMAQALKTKFPESLAYVGQAAAAGGSILSTIASISYVSAYDEGGRIPTGSVGIVGEYGPEFVQGPANVTSREDTRKLLERAASGEQGKASHTVVRPEVRVVNVVDPRMVGHYMRTPDGVEAVLNIVQAANTRWMGSRRG